MSVQAHRITVETLSVDCVNARRVAEFWCDLLGYVVVPNDTESILIADPEGAGVRLLFSWEGRPKRDKNRLHLDLRPAVDQHWQVQRAIALGATRADVGETGDEGWVVLADPEGNEFCVLQTLDDVER